MVSMRLLSRCLVRHSVTAMAYETAMAYDTSKLIGSSHTKFPLAVRFWFQMAMQVQLSARVVR